MFRERQRVEGSVRKARDELELRVRERTAELAQEVEQRRQAEAGFWIPSYKTFDEFWSQVAERGGWWDPVAGPRDPTAAFQTPSGKYEFFCLGLGLGLGRPGAAASGGGPPMPARSPRRR